MGFPAKCLPITLRSIDSSTLAGSYTTFGSRVDVPLITLRIFNDSNVDVFVSRDGVNNHWVVPASTYLVEDVRTNSATNHSGALPETQFYINGAAGTGNIYLGGLYQA